MRKSLFAAALLAFSSLAQSGVVFDWSPVTTGGTVTNDNWTNERPGQRFAETVTLGSTAFVNGMDIYNSNQFGAVGSAVVVTFWNDGGGAPGSVAAQFFTNVSVVDTVGAYADQHRLHADFAGFNMLFGVTYWVGMAGDGVLLTQTGLNGVAGGNGTMYQLNGSDIDPGFNAQIGDMAFRLSADVQAISEPASLALFGLALAGLGMRRRKKA